MVGDARTMKQELQGMRTGLNGHLLCLLTPGMQNRRIMDRLVRAAGVEPRAILNETAKHTHIFLPGSSFPEKDGASTNAGHRINRVRKVMSPMPGLADWEATITLSNALGLPMRYRHHSEIMDEVARLTPSFSGVLCAKIDQLGSPQRPRNEAAPLGMPMMHVDRFAAARAGSC